MLGEHIVTMTSDHSTGPKWPSKRHAMNLWNGRSNASEQEEAAVFEVANLLNDGLREAKEEINRIRQDQGAIEEA
jgi:hypothetical protein